MTWNTLTVNNWSTIVSILFSNFFKKSSFVQRKLLVDVLVTQRIEAKTQLVNNNQRRKSRPNRSLSYYKATGFVLSIMPI